MDISELKQVAQQTINGITLPCNMTGAAKQTYFQDITEAMVDTLTPVIKNWEKAAYNRGSAESRRV